MSALPPHPHAVRTTCPYCGVGCGVLAVPDRDGGATISGDPAHPANFGRLCSKGSALGETLALDQRLLHPMMRQADGSLVARRLGCGARRGRERLARDHRARRARMRSRSISPANCSPRTITSPTS